MNARDLAGNLLLFLLVFGMSATVDMNALLAQLNNRRAIFTGILLQFVILPFLGFVSVNALGLEHAMGITLLVVTSSPGGSYSNWWCSLFNADLALSVTMTAISTILSIVTLPLNLLLYATYSYESHVVSSLDWASLFTALVVVMGAILLGLLVSAQVHSHRFNMMANKCGNLAGVALIVFSFAVSNTGDARLYERNLSFYVGVAAPCVFGLFIANVATTFFQLKRPERVTVSVECCYQNVGIATSVALTMFQGDDLSDAMGVPVFYGMVEGAVLGAYCLWAWKSGWTKAPPTAPLWDVLFTSYEVLCAEQAELSAVEVSLRPPAGGDGGHPSKKKASSEPAYAEEAEGDTLHHYFHFMECAIVPCSTDTTLDSLGGGCGDRSRPKAPSGQLESHPTTTTTTTPPLDTTTSPSKSETPTTNPEDVAGGATGTSTTGTKAEAAPGEGTGSAPIV